MTSPLDGEILPSSFRDPSGFLFKKDGNLYRQINPCYQKDYTLLKASGLYEQLVKNEWLISHEEIPKGTVPENGDSPQNIKPEHLPFISYPYEWSFEQLKDAALLTLEIQKLSIEKGMSLKDASAFNIQFKNAKPILIDTLSFETYKEGEPWVAYRQFCQHFLAPLALMAHVDVRLLQLFRVHMDGIPLDLTSRLLPMRTKFQFSLLTHIHIHAKAQAKYAD